MLAHAFFLAALGDTGHLIGLRLPAGRRWSWESPVHGVFWVCGLPGGTVLSPQMWVTLWSWAFFLCWREWLSCTDHIHWAMMPGEGRAVGSKGTCISHLIDIHSLRPPHQTQITHCRPAQGKRKVSFCDWRFTKTKPNGMQGHYQQIFNKHQLISQVMANSGKCNIEHRSF